MGRQLSGLAVALVVIVSAFATGALAAIDDAGAVRTAVMGFADAWNRHDMNAFGKLFTTDADFVNVAGDRWKGREQIQTQHAYSHGAITADTPGFDAESRAYYGIFRTSTMRFDQIDVRFLGNDVALAHITWALRGDTRTTNPRRGVFLFVLTRQADAWLIAAAQNTEIGRTVK